ncbi:MAG: calcium/sodium antiporter [Planctomycetota bacterium]
MSNMAIYHLAELIGGIALLVFGAEALVRGAERIAKAAGVSSFVIGLTVVAFGTSAPELAGSLGAAFRGDPSLAVANVVGSNIANVCLILGATALVCPVPVRVAAVRAEVGVMIGVSVLAVALMIGGGMHRIEGGVLVALLAAFLVRSYRAGRASAQGDGAAADRELVEELDDEVGTAKAGIAVPVLMVFAGLAMLYFGAEWLVSGATALAEMAGVSTAVIGLSLVAFGTSVPELVLSMIAAFRKKADIAIGNILGSNIFNLLCVLGFTSLLSPERLPPTEGFWFRDAPVMLVAAVACVPIILTGHRVSRIEGGLLLGLYGAYLVTLFLTSQPGAAAAGG